MKISKPSFLILLSAIAVFAAADSAFAQRQARKFDELAIGIGSPRTWRPGEHEEEEKVMKRHMLRYARQLKKEQARAYIVGYAPRIVQWENYNRSYGDMRAGQAKSALSEFFDYQKIQTIDGGFRETAVTELWIVPTGAQPPRPTPTIRPEDVAHCPLLRINGSPNVPASSGPLEFKATLESNGDKISAVFTWQVSPGKIIKGQGTDTIAVAVPEGFAGTVIAKVDVSGYPLECPTQTVSSRYQTEFGLTHFKVDEYGDICDEDEQARLDNFAVQLQANPELQGYLIYYGGRCYSSCSYDYPRHRPRYPRRGEAKARADRIKPYLVDRRGLNPARIVVVDGGHRESWTAELWMSPKGLMPPAATPTVQPADIVYRTGKPTKREFVFGCLGIAR